MLFECSMSCWVVDAVHRIGEKKTDSARPIIVRFVSRKTRAEVLRHRRKLKGSNPKVVIVDDLTKSNYSLFHCVSDHPGVLKAWSKDGKIFAQSLDRKIFRIDNLTDLSRKISIDDAASSSSQPFQRRLAFRQKRWSDIFKPLSSEPDSDQTKNKKADAKDQESKV